MLTRLPLLLLALTAVPLFAAPPKVGEIAPDFALRTLTDERVEFRALRESSPVVLVVLRGWPGYQCPMCTAQVHDFVQHAAEFKQRGVRVVMIYPGPAGQLQAHAHEFLEDKSWPADFVFLLDPSYRFTESYGLRWNAKSETAYPSTFVVQTNGQIAFAQVSHSHGDRAGAGQILSKLP